MGHNHPPEDDRLERRGFVDQVIQEITQDPSQPIRRVYDNIFNAIPQMALNLQAIPAFETIRSQLQRTRVALRPAIPRRIQDVAINGVWAESWDGNRRLLDLDNGNGVAIFATDSELTALQECRTLHFDGTFRTAPHPYVQIVTIHGVYRNTEWVIPLGMALLTGKTQQQYEIMLQALKDGVVNATGRPLDPRNIVTDFEASLMQAINVKFPNSRTMGCYYHFCSSLWRRIQQLGLQIGYQQNQLLRRLLRRFMSLGYLPLNNVRASYQ